MTQTQEAATKDVPISIKVLESLCQSVNAPVLKRSESYKQAEAFLRTIGFKYCEVNFVNSYKYGDSFIDLYEYLNGRVSLYVRNNEVIACKIVNPPYQFRKHMSNTLVGYAVLELADCITYEKL